MLAFQAFWLVEKMNSQSERIKIIKCKSKLKFIDIILPLICTLNLVWFNFSNVSYRNI